MAQKLSTPLVCHALDEFADAVSHGLVRMGQALVDAGLVGEHDGVILDVRVDEVPHMQAGHAPDDLGPDLAQAPVLDDGHGRFPNPARLAAGALAGVLVLLIAAHVCLVHFHRPV